MKLPNQLVNIIITNDIFYTKNKDGGDYEGWCWPGASYYPDFLNGDVRQYFAEQYRLENYQGTNLVRLALTNLYNVFAVCGCTEGLLC